ncbi:MAG: DoxX family protein [Synechocystis sp.]
MIRLPIPIFFSYIAAYTELIGAPLVALGLLTRPAALGLFGTMAVAMYHHILVAGFSIPYLELSAVYAVCFLFLAVNGAGLLSLDALIVSKLDRLALQNPTLYRQSLEEGFQQPAVDGFDKVNSPSK